MRIYAIALFLALAACGGSDDAGNKAAAPGGDGRPQPQAGKQAAPPGPAKSAVQTAALTGLYEGAAGPQRSQLCIIDKGSGNAQFGINIWGGNMHSCSGAGSAVRAGNKLSLTMAGDQSCTLNATIEGGRVTMPKGVAQGCAYYCGSRARFDGQVLERTGSSAADAMKAVDLAGDPLCDGSSG
ncbi:MAG TPA: hypothetical protein VEZ70_04355 [Allosphingosinicella sp.]|nr:hypothetical protein [Allosphingosinicella sp.]